MCKRDTDRPAPGDAPVLPEITPEMIEAGADVILGCDLEFFRAHQIAEMVFNTMLACRNCAPAKNRSSPRKHQI
jgi:hypothetical protein